jgi:hypothetical protein
MKRVVTDAQRRARLAVRHRLLPRERTNDIATITDDLVALHSSDPVTVFLSAAARMQDPSVAAIESALYEERTVLRHHAMRRTLWVMTPAAARQAHASSTRKIHDAEVRRHLPLLAAAPGIDNAEEWFTAATDRLVDIVREAGAITTRDVGRKAPEIAAVELIAGRGTAGEATLSAHTRLLMLAAFAGRLVRTTPVGTWISSQYRWAPIEDWHATDLDGLTTETASAQLVDHYLRRFGPATETDIVWWTGWTKTQARGALTDAGAEEVGLEAGTPAWMSAADEPAVDTEPWLALLPSLDPTTMGWKERSWYLDDDLAARLFDRNGNAGPTVWLDGRVVGGWAQRPDGSIATEFPNGFPADRNGDLAAEIDRLRTFIGDMRFRVRFPTPSLKALLT